MLSNGLRKRGGRSQPPSAARIRTAPLVPRSASTAAGRSTGPAQTDSALISGSANQRHVNAAIFNIWHYFQTTNDQAFLRDYGAEMMLEIIRFGASIAHFNPERERYEIHGVMGPDEFHDKYPDAPQGGLRNNAYTNVLVAWLCGIAGQLLPLLPASRAEALRLRLGIGDSELAVWQDMSRRMFVPFHGDGIISQFEGYEDLDELDWDAYRAKYGNIQRLDRILRAEGKDPNRYKVTKQADTVMLFFLFRQDELREIFGWLRYDYRADTLTRNVAYYDRRTSHGSTLSFVTHAGVLAVTAKTWGHPGNLTEAMNPVFPWAPSVRVIKHPFERDFTIVEAPTELGTQSQCGATPPKKFEPAATPQYGTYYGALLQIVQEGRPGGTIVFVWRRLEGEWRLVAYRAVDSIGLVEAAQS